MLNPKSCSRFTSQYAFFIIDFSGNDRILWRYIEQLGWIVTLGSKEPHSPRVIMFDVDVLAPRVILNYHKCTLSISFLPVNLLPHMAPPYVITGLIKLSNGYAEIFGDNGPIVFVFFFHKKYTSFRFIIKIFVIRGKHIAVGSSNRSNYITDIFILIDAFSPSIAFAISSVVTLQFNISYSVLFNTSSEINLLTYARRNSFISFSLSTHQSFLPLAL